jgi:hypothetical protein
MVYLAIDTDVWLHLAATGFDKEQNLFDELCYWIEASEVKCIVPDQIVREWQRNQEDKIKRIQIAINASAGELQQVVRDDHLLNKLFSARNFESVCHSRVARIEKLFKEQVLIAPVTDEVMIAAGKRTLERIAPSHGKDSYSDAVNILAITAYIRAQGFSRVYFNSHNHSDYSAVGDKKVLHPDLELLFNDAGLTYVTDVNYLFYQLLRPQLSSFTEHLAAKKKALVEQQEIVAEMRRSELANADEDYIGNVAMMEQVLALAKPTQFQFQIIGQLIDNDVNCRKYFFGHVDKPVWLPFFEERGLLDPGRHPVPGPDGRMATWEPLPFLERLSQQVKSGTAPGTMPTLLLAQVRAVSAAGVDNDYTFSVLIRVLANLPNDVLTDEVLDLLPSLFSDHTNRMFPSSAVGEHLLPKFIREDANEGDIAKGERILHFLLGLNLKGMELDNTVEKSETSFYGNAYPWQLTETLIRKELVKVVAKRCLPDLFLFFARNIKLLILDYPKGLQIPVQFKGTEAKVKVTVVLPSAHFWLIDPVTEQVIAEETLVNIEGLSRADLRLSVIGLLEKLGLAIDLTEEMENRLLGLTFALTVDRLSTAHSNAIAEMDIDHYHSKHFRGLYAAILVTYLDEISQVLPGRAVELSQKLFYDPEYQLPFFRRMVLHNLGAHFNTQRELLPLFFSPDDPEGLFGDHIYRADLFGMLRTIQFQLNEAERSLLSAILQAGPKDDENRTSESVAYWQFRWYSALEQTDPFATRYRELSEEMQMDSSQVDPNRTIRFRSGSLPPLSVEELLGMDDQGIADYLFAFEVKERWEGPNFEGLSDIFKQAVLAQPLRFLNSLDKFIVTPFIYVYHLLYALLDVGRKDSAGFDWSAVIRFCRAYVSQADFMSEDRKLLGDGWKADHFWVMGVVAYLLSDFCNSDTIEGKAELLPAVEATLLTMDAHHSPSHGSDIHERDYISHFYNSDNGKFLRACMDYCLCKNRLLSLDQPVFADRFRTIFDKYLDAGSIDALAIFGHYWQQFNYLDHTWFMKRLETTENLAEPAWGAFMGGFLFARAPNTVDILLLVAPSYKRAIDQQLIQKASGHNGLAAQMASLYLWDVVTLSEESLMVRYLNRMSAEGIRDLLHVIYFSSSYYEALNEEEFVFAETKVLALIERIQQSYENAEDPTFLEIRRSTVNLVMMARKLHALNTAMIAAAVQLASKQYHHDDLFEPLRKLTAHGEPLETAAYLAEVLQLMTFHNGIYLIDRDKENLKEMIKFLYANGQGVTANKLCNRLMIAGCEFVRPLFEDYHGGEIAR